MATKYTFFFSDTTKSDFSLFPYTSDGPTSPSDSTLIDQATAQSTTLKLYGQGMQNYGEGIFQNFIYMLENFAAPSAPINAIEGQFWYENSGEILSIRNNVSTWIDIILANGNSPMTGELILSGNPTNVLAAAPKQYIDSHTNDVDVHITSDQNTFLTALILTGSPPLLPEELNALKGLTIGSPMVSVQDQFNDKLSRQGDTLDSGADLTINAGNLNLTNGSGSPINGHIILSGGDITSSTGDFILNGGNILSNGGDLTLDAGNINLINGSGSPINGHLILSGGDISLSTGNLTLGAGDINITNGNIVFTSTGSPITSEILGLTSTPSATGATSKEYVDAQISSGSGGDGVLDSFVWSSAGGGSPVPVITDTTLELTVLFPSTATNTFIIEGISRDGHAHTADEITFDNTGSPALTVSGATVQDVIKNIDFIKAPIVTPVFAGQVQLNGSLSVTNNSTFDSNVSSVEPQSPEHLTIKNYVDTASAIATLSVARLLNTLGAELSGSPITPYLTLAHSGNDNKLSISINGIKQYGNTYGEQSISYDTNVGSITNFTYTGLDESVDHDFEITVDGSGPTTCTISSGTSLNTHEKLVSAVNDALTTAVVAASFAILGNGRQVFTSDTSGSGSSILIGDPGTGGSPETIYLFDQDGAPTVITNVTFFSEPQSPTGTPDELVFPGDVTANFSVGKSFTIRGSIAGIYGNYDGVYKVHSNGAVALGSPLETTVPIAWVGDQTMNTPLVFEYNPTGSPAQPFPVTGSPPQFGSVYFTPIAGFDQVSTAIDGTVGDYIETISSGAEVKHGEFTDHVVFNYTIPTGTRIESILF